ncbi:MAG: LPXTG cell wall anchor domain-containing protein, partial [Roseiflexaceae bacterium]|nr:LPXTG cell wall anchor domain-containing protein [Roseiflexaceae bacterium]
TAPLAAAPVVEGTSGQLPVTPMRVPPSAQPATAGTSLEIVLLLGGMGLLIGAVLVLRRRL